MIKWSGKIDSNGRDAPRGVSTWLIISLMKYKNYVKYYWNRNTWLIISWPTISSNVWSKTKNHCNNTYGPQPPWSLGVIINQMKWSITRQINKNHYTIWFARQPGYYERIIRDERELWNVRRYIEDNPRKWRRVNLYW